MSTKSKSRLPKHLRPRPQAATVKGDRKLPGVMAPKLDAPLTARIAETMFATYAGTGAPAVLTVHGAEATWQAVVTLGSFGAHVGAFGPHVQGVLGDLCNDLTGTYAHWKHAVPLAALGVAMAGRKPEMSSARINDDGSLTPIGAATDDGVPEFATLAGAALQDAWRASEHDGEAPRGPVDRWHAFVTTCLELAGDAATVPVAAGVDGPQDEQAAE